MSSELTVFSLLITPQKSRLHQLPIILKCQLLMKLLWSPRGNYFSAFDQRRSIGGIAVRSFIWWEHWGTSCLILHAANGLHCLSWTRKIIVLLSYLSSSLTIYNVTDQAFTMTIKDSVVKWCCKSVKKRASEIWFCITVDVLTPFVPNLSGDHV